MDALTESVLKRFAQLLPPENPEPDWTAPAFRWVRRTYMGTVVGRLEAVPHFAHVDVETLIHINEQKAQLLTNTEQFVRGLPANNVLLTGARGTGKSSLIRGCCTRFYEDGLRLIEVGKDDLCDLADIVRLTSTRPERFIVFCDDLSFELGEGGYKALKAALDGSVAAGGENLLIYATSSRRHLMPESFTPGKCWKKSSLWQSASVCGFRFTPSARRSTSMWCGSRSRRWGRHLRLPRAKTCGLKPCSLPFSGAAEAAAWPCSMREAERDARN